MPSGSIRRIMSERVKLVVFVPKSYADVVRQAFGEAGAGRIGLYSDCSWSVEGLGMFKPLEGAHPAIGEVGGLEQVQETRIESICDRSIARAVRAAVRKVHPYEEVAFDIYPLIDEADL